MQVNNLLTRWLLAGVGLAAGFCPTVSAQNPVSRYRIQHQQPTVVERHEETRMQFTVPELNPSDVQEAILFYSYAGEVAYRQVHATLSRNTFTVPLTVGDPASSSLEYYFEIRLNSGGTLVYPDDFETGGPVRIEIVEASGEPGTVERNETGIEYTILSPEPGDLVAPTDVVIAITLFYDPGTVDTSASSVQMLLDGEDVTGQADTGDYFFAYTPERMPPGTHNIRLQLADADSSRTIVAWSFLVGGPDTPDPYTGTGISGPGTGPGTGRSAVSDGQLQITARNQVIGGNASDIVSGNFRVSGRKGDTRYSAYGLLTSLENPRLPQQNRYGADLYVGEWLQLQAGHLYPSLSPLMIAGQRLLGVKSSLRMFDKAVSLEFIYGKLRRGITNIYQPVRVQQVMSGSTVVDTSYALNFENGGIGTYKRDLIGGRVDFGRGEDFRIGFNLLKVQDDTGSISVISDYNDLLRVQPELADRLSSEDRDKLQQEPGLLGVNGNPRPRGNLVAGSDLELNIDNDRLRFRTDAAFSLLNDDISRGPLTQELADELGFNIEPSVESLLDRLSWLIIINENMKALPLRFDDQGDITQDRTFIPGSTLASESELMLNYFDNSLQIRHRWVGPHFYSLANTAIRNDIAGVTVTDRFRLFRDRLYVTLGYEDLNNNVTDQMPATTGTVTLRGNVSWYPVQPELPRLSIGLMSRNRDNDVLLFNPYVPVSQQAAALQNFELTDGDTLLTANARQASTTQFTASVTQQFELFGISHDASLSYSMLKTREQRFAYGNAVSNSLSMTVINRFDSLPLDSRFGFNYNRFRSSSGLTDIRIGGFHAGGSVFLMDDRLNIDLSVAVTGNSTETTPLTVADNGTPEDSSDDIYEPDRGNTEHSRSRSFVVSAGGRYTFNRHHSFLVDLRFTNVDNRLTGAPLPDDRILQARYVYSF